MRNKTGNQALITTLLPILQRKARCPASKNLAKENHESAVSAACECAIFSSSSALLVGETTKVDKVLKGAAVKAAESHTRNLLQGTVITELCQKNRDIGSDVLKACYQSNDNVVKKCPNFRYPGYVYDYGYQSGPR